MKYKGFNILPSYTVGSTFTIRKNGRVVDRKPTKADIEYYEIYDPMVTQGDGKWVAETTIAECKESIDDLLKLCGILSNAPSVWAKMDADDKKKRAT
jgi:hypothetical protein